MMRVLLATGRVPEARDIGGPGSGLPGIVPSLDFLIASNRKGLGDDVPDFDSGLLNAAGKHVVVIGGGDTAMDCVRTSVRQGAASVSCLYRRDKAPTCPGSLREVNNAEEEGVRFVWLSAPEAFLGEQPCERRSARCTCGWGCPMRPDVSPSRWWKGSQFSLQADLVIKALGFDPEPLPQLWGQDGAGR